VAHFYVNRAMSTMQLGRYELARDDLLTALRLSPNNERAQRLIAQLSPGDA
jgi:Tfp pilus assembly protein PilF